MAQKREKEETELKVPTPIPTPPKLEPTKASSRPSVTSDPVRSAPGSDRSGSDPDPGVETTSPARKPETAATGVNRCSGCRRKVGLTGFRCRCGDLFCSEHRYSDRHDCSFDYKAAGREAIERENPVVRPAKILKV